MSTGPLTKTLHFLPNILPQPICSEQMTLFSTQTPPGGAERATLPYLPLVPVFPLQTWY